MENLFESTLFPVVLTLAAYQTGLWAQRKTRLAVFSPILIAAVLTASFLLVSGVPNSVYQSGCAVFSWLLTPATVCLAIPLYTQLQVLRDNKRAVAAGIAAGVAASLVSVFALSRCMALDTTLFLSLLPKSITTAMGIAVSEAVGGVSGITTAAIILTGILGSVFGPVLCRLLRLTHPVAQGAAFGTACHVIGTAKAAEMSETAGAVGSLSLVCAGILTAVLCPLAAPLYGL